MKQLIEKGRYFLFAVTAYCLTMALPFRSSGQSTEIQQLILNAEKLSQFKNILRDMKTGYDIISNGYNAIRNIAEGNFSLHTVFLDGLMLVSPEVKKYGRVADIISLQGRINSEYRSALSHFRGSAIFNSGELEYMANVYGRLLNQSKDNLEDLLLVITSSQLRMSDEERLAQIDRIYNDIQDKLLFLRKFNESGNVLLMQRKREINDIKGISQFFNGKNL
ncbi:TerB family tellurite resistance protein [Olivibacter sp. 47]|uniref:TerB family tellurite resistance protein n=1 Tax=Olivibacter sp. 47 TaxID=3056486 RepID=UPI0025A33C98|nr:TerB family tellurite resistance protein [Olivibacter sp. 47]MDM8172951.1 TerB family tellurite resistance protein [Olivibacter sp. 47]